MAGNRNSGRRPKPPTPEDSLSELLLDLQGQIVEMEAAAQTHARAQRHRRRVACQTIDRIADGWREVRGLYPAEPAGAQVIPFPTHRPEPSGAVAA